MKSSLLSLLFFFAAAYCDGQTTSIPDANFEGYLVSFGIDSDGIVNGQVLTADIVGVTTLDVTWLSISSLIGIEDFAALTNLNCSFNSLSSLDVTQNVNLSELRCAANLITELDVTQNTALVTLDFVGDQLTQIDLSQNLLLETLWALDNQLTTLDLSLNSALTTIGCWDNMLTFLNVANGNNTAVISFNAYNNPDLFCINVDDSTYSADNWTGAIDAQSYFSTNCYVGIDETAKNDLLLYPNPIENNLYFTVLENSSYVLISSSGQKIIRGRSYPGENSIDLREIESGVYFFLLQNSEGLHKQRIVKL